MGDGLVKILIDFAGRLEKGLLLVAQHRICVLLTAVWVVLPKLDLESKLEFDYLFLELVMIRGSTCIKALSSTPEGRPSEISICQPSQEAADYPWRSVEDKLVSLLIFKHLQNLLLVVLDCSSLLRG